MAKVFRYGAIASAFLMVAGSTVFAQSYNNPGSTTNQGYGNTPGYNQGGSYNRGTGQQGSSGAGSS